MTKLTDEDLVKLYKLEQGIKSGEYSGETISIPAEIALVMLRKMLLAEHLFDGAYYDANASYGSNHIEGKASSRKEDRDACKKVVQYLRKAIIN